MNKKIIKERIQNILCAVNPERENPSVYDYAEEADEIADFVNSNQDDELLEEFVFDVINQRNYCVMSVEVTELLMESLEICINHYKEVDEKLKKFEKMQNLYFDTALKEISSGKKETHWIWYIFPQLTGLGKSEMSLTYGLTVEEAERYIENKYLFNNLIKISESLLKLDTNTILEIVDTPDNLKICSCMTLFKHLTNEKVFSDVLKKFYGGAECKTTIEKLGNKK